MTDVELSRKTPDFNSDLALSEINVAFVKIVLLVSAIYLLLRVVFRDGDPGSMSGYLSTLPFLCIVATPVIYAFLLAVFFLGGFSVTVPKRRWLKSAARTKAIIVDKRIREDWESRDDYSYQFSVSELRLKYVPTRAKNKSSEQMLWASIHSSIYEKYELDDTVDIFYSLTDPSLFLIEGE